MQVAKASSDLILEAEDINDSSDLVMYSKRRVQYPVALRGEKEFEELKREAQNYSAQYFLVERIRGARRRSAEYKVLVRYLGLDAGDDDTWEAPDTMRKDFRVLEAFLYTTGDRNMKKKTTDIYIFNKEFYLYRNLGAL